MVGSMQQFYGKVRAAFGDTNYGYVAELEESEDRLLGAFKDVLQDNDLPPAVRQEVTQLLPDAGVPQRHAGTQARHEGCLTSRAGRPIAAVEPRGASWPGTFAARQGCEGPGVRPRSHGYTWPSPGTGAA
jgi:hypothetical protein